MCTLFPDMQGSVLTVNGTAVKVGAGPSSQGIFVNIKRDGPGKDEVSIHHTARRHDRCGSYNTDTVQEYQIGLPSAAVNGILKGVYYGTISDQIDVTCRGGSGGTKYRALLDYKEEVSPPFHCIGSVADIYSRGSESPSSSLMVSSTATMSGTLSKRAGPKRSRCLQIASSPISRATG